MADLAKLQQQKYYDNHKQYKVYLDTEKDAKIVKMLNECDNRSALIRRAIIFYFKCGKVPDKMM